MPTIPLTVRSQTFLADMVTPVGLYLAIRSRYPGSLLLESSDYRSSENSRSFICFDPIAKFVAYEDRVLTVTPDGATTTEEIESPRAVPARLQAFLRSFDPTGSAQGGCNGFFGFTGYDAVQCFEDIEFARAERTLPLLQYSLFRYVITLDHFRSTMTIVQNSCDGELLPFPELESMIQSAPVRTRFHADGREQSNRTDEAHIALVEKVKVHIQRGDVFQIVPSRQFSQRYEGDDFEVYRELRSLNPSPFLFYFDCGAFRLIGSSPEAQLLTKESRASICSIAGTYRRTGNDAEDLAAAERLKQDPKENAEHVMLVDLARNDLSRFCHPVAVEEFRAIQFYSHVIHLVSRIVGEMPSDLDPLTLLGASFPAGTLSGAPKYRAMELIDRYEELPREWYGGCLGFFGFNGESVHAILIRTMLSQDNTLSYRAGSGVVLDSDPQTETQEVHHKLRALRQAIDQASRRCS
ncbi:MAG: anthranilate synthase component I family protein [Deltaproteobacteria bacterium]|nr:anthranilate synthase component I family protein [Deltaproteobacteria bacterium]